MKSEISRDSYQSEKRYSGVYQQQGRMLTDADWNELVEILKSRLNEALRDIVGSEQGSVGGTPRHRALSIIDDSGIKIQPGHIYIDGMAASLPESDPLNFDEQTDFPHPPSPTDNYLVYADMWERSITHLMDQRLLDAGLHGADTCTRKQMLAQVKWCPDSIDPEQSALNPAKGDAGLTLTLLQKTTDPDTCDPCAAELDIDSRVGNYLFRVEVHDVQGDANNPTGITLKWSSENGAEQFEALATEDAMPAGFISDKWVYEFFDETTERHVGVHLNNTSWQPSRVGLVVFNEIAGGYAVPTIPDSTESTTLVRRWDGYCKIDLSSGVLLEGMDRGVELDTGKAVDSLGYVSISIGSTLQMVLNSLSIELDINSKSFVAGDFWLADVREAVHSEGSKLLINQPPQGIPHYYLTLASVTAGVLQENPEIDRKYAFPPLTQMTRLFMAGGDGQEIVPGESLPQPLRVGVANGEWPVIGATVRFVIEEGGGSLNVVSAGLTDAQGIAECEWTPDAVITDTYCVKATLVDPDNPSDASKDLLPPVYFYANLISADQVAYAPQCQPDTVEASVHHLLLGPDDSRLGSDDYYTVKQVLDALLCEMKADHIPYDDPGCDTHTVKSLLANLDFNSDGLLTVKDVLDTLLCKLKADHIPYDDPGCDTHTVGSLLVNLDFNSDGQVTVKDILDTLLCKLEAQHLPYDPTVHGSRWDDINEGGDRPDTVQQAIDDLVSELDATDIPVDRNSLCTKLKSATGVNRVDTIQDAINQLCKVVGGGGCAISVGDGGTFPTLEEALKIFEDKPGSQISICLLPGDHVFNEIKVANADSFTLDGHGAARVSLMGMFDIQSTLINITGIQFSVVDDEKSSIGTGYFNLSTLSDGKTVVENCVFKRIYFGVDEVWRPVVTVGNKFELQWNNNRMLATREIEQKIGILPKEEDLGVTGKDVLVEFNTLLAMNAMADSAAYNSQAEMVADKIITMDAQSRTEWFEKRPVKDINSLPEVRGRTPALLSGSTPALAGGLLRTAPVSTSSPKETVTKFYDLFNTTTTQNKAEILEAIKEITLLSYKTDYALALQSNQVGGWIKDNDISGYLVLHYEQEKAVSLSWQSNSEPERLKNKDNFSQSTIDFNWPAENQINITGNNVVAVLSMVTQATLDEIEKILSGTFDSALTIQAYESMSVKDNVFYQEENSFIAKFCNLEGNHFMFNQRESSTVLAYAYGYRGMIINNQSLSQFNPINFRIEQFFNAYLPRGTFNFMQVI